MMETSVLIQVPYELEKVYSPLEERNDIDYVVMPVDNFNVSDFLMGVYITISSDPVAAGVMSGMIWDRFKFYLSKIFKEAYGTTVNNYLISKRITRAKQLLRFTDMTVDEVGVTVGMGDANYFSRMFRKVEGISPREYRKQW